MPWPKGCIADGRAGSVRFFARCGHEGAQTAVHGRSAVVTKVMQRYFYILMEDSMKSMGIEQLNIGDTASISRSFSAEDVAAFAALSYDRNPAHLDEEYAKGTMFKTRIVHGMLVASLFSAILGTRLPGLGTIYTDQSVKFLRPVYLDEEVTATLTVKEIILERRRVIFDCLVVNAKGEPVITGEARVLPPQV